MCFLPSRKLRELEVVLASWHWLLDYLESLSPDASKVNDYVIKAWCVTDHFTSDPPLSHGYVIALVSNHGSTDIFQVLAVCMTLG